MFVGAFRSGPGGEAARSDLTRAVGRCVCAPGARGVGRMCAMADGRAAVLVVGFGAHGRMVPVLRATAAIASSSVLKHDRSAAHTPRPRGAACPLREARPPRPAASAAWPSCWPRSALSTMQPAHSAQGEYSLSARPSPVKSPVPGRRSEGQRQACARGAYDCGPVLCPGLSTGPPPCTTRALAMGIRSNDGWALGVRWPRQSGWACSARHRPAAPGEELSLAESSILKDKM